MECIDFNLTSSSFVLQIHLQIYVIDSADRRRMEESGVELKQILDEERLADTPLLIMANKNDLMNAMEASEVRDWRVNFFSLMCVYVIKLNCPHII